MGSFGVGRKIKERRQGKHNKCAKNFGTPKNMLSAQITPKRRRGRDGGRGSSTSGAWMALTAAKVTLTSVARACPRGQRSSHHGQDFHLLFMPSLPPIFILFCLALDYRHALLFIYTHLFLGARVLWLSDFWF